MIVNSLIIHSIAYLIVGRYSESKISLMYSSRIIFVVVDQNFFNFRFILSLYMCELHAVGRMH